MPLTPGTSLGPYQIDAPLGAGGMGEVYKATDTQLNRQVALKILPEAFASDPDRLVRYYTLTLDTAWHQSSCGSYDNYGRRELWGVQHDGRPQ